MPPSKFPHETLFRREEPISNSGLSPQDLPDPNSLTSSAPSSEPSNSNTVFILAIVGSSLGTLFIVIFAFRFFRKSRLQPHPRRLSLKSETESFPDPHHYNQSVPDKCLGSTRLGSLSRAVRKPFRNSRNSFFNRHSTSDFDQDGIKKLDSFEDILWRGGGVSNKLGLSEVELSQILSANQGNSISAAGTSVETQTTLPTDSWDQYMSILKHEEHLHFEDITPVASTAHSSADFSRHRHHPSLLSHYFHSTIGSLNLNRVEPLNNTKPTLSDGIELKKTRHNSSGIRRHFSGGSTGSLINFKSEVPTQVLVTATVASGFNPVISQPLQVPTSSLTSPSHNKDFNWNSISDNSQFTTSPTALAPFRRPSLEIKIFTPSPAKVNPSGFKSPHLVDPGRLSALIESSPLAPEPLEPRKSLDSYSENVNAGQKA